MPESPSVTELRRQLQTTEQDARQLREAVRRAEERARLAEHSAVEAWRFAKTVLRVDR